MKAAVKVSVYWGDILYDTVLCEPNGKPLTVGRKPGSTIHLDLATESKRDTVELVKLLPHDRAEIHFDPHFEGHVRFGKSLVTLGSAIKKNEALPIEDGFYRLILSDKDKAEIMLGHVTFFIDWVKERPKIHRLNPFRWGNLLATLIFLALSAPFIMMLLSIPPGIEAETPPERLVPILPKMKPKPIPTPPPAPAEAAIGEKKTTDGGADKKPPGKVELKKPQKKPVEKKKPVVKPPPVPARVTKAPAQNATSAAETIRSADLGNLVQGLTNLGSNDAPKADKVAIEAPIAQTGTGGLSTEGLKKGGGGKTVGIGRTVGQGEGGFGGTGKLGLSTSAIGAKGTGKGYGKLPAAVSEGLDREVVDNIVRQRKDRIRLCYERQLNFYPKLTGKLTIHFVIGKAGAVEAANILDDTMQNEAVRTCLINEVQTWTFPKPQGGSRVTVDYPFVFESSSARGQ